MSRYGLGTIYLRGDLWWIQYWRNGQRHRESSDSERKDDAVKLLKRRQGEAIAGKLASRHMRMSQLLDLVLQDYIRHKRKSIYDLKLRIDRQLRPKIGRIRVEQFGSEAIQCYIEQRTKAGIQAATVNRELAVVKRSLVLAMQHDPPLIGRIPHIPALKENPPRKGFVEDRTYAAILRELPKPIRLLAALAYRTGARKGELLGLRVDQVDLELNQIRLHAGETKNDEGRVLPIYGDVREMIAARLHQRTTQAKRSGKFPLPWLCIHEDGRQVRQFDRSWRSACVRAGFPALLFHDLRRSAVRNMERAGIPRSVAMKISGHKTEAVYRRYSIVSSEDIAEAGRKLEAMGKKPKEKKA
jgi:integrase